MNNAYCVTSRGSVISDSCMSCSDTISILYDAQHFLRRTRGSFTQTLHFNLLSHYNTEN